MNTAKHLSNNVKISGIPEVEGENPFETVKEFLKTTGGIEAKEGENKMPTSGASPSNVCEMLTQFPQIN